MEHKELKLSGQVTWKVMSGKGPGYKEGFGTIEMPLELGLPMRIWGDYGIMTSPVESLTHFTDTNKIVVKTKNSVYELTVRNVIN